MSKYTRHNIPGHAHELTFSCYKQRPFLKSSHVKSLLADSITRASEIHNFEIWAYVLMPEHVHLMIYPCDESYSISKILTSIKQPVSRSILNKLREQNSLFLRNMETGLDNPKYRFWQDGGGYDRHYFSPEEIRKQMNYIHNNPVRRGLVENPCDYKWSSAGYWLNEEEGIMPVKFDSLSLI
jgi:putative transposase